MIDREGRTPLFYAIADKDIDLAVKLIAQGAAINIQDKGGLTPLHFASLHDQTSIAEELIKAGAEIDIQDLHGNTPLWRAVFESRGKDKMIRILIAAGADKTIENKSGISPVKLAENIGNFDILSILEG